MSNVRKMDSLCLIADLRCTWCLEKNKTRSLTSAIHSYAEYFYVIQWSRVDATQMEILTTKIALLYSNTSGTTAG